ncbi:MAG: hypothetical protein ACJAXK_003129 [Yoonia sp.]|jgi:hypothetical protein
MSYKKGAKLPTKQTLAALQKFGKVASKQTFEAGEV